MKHAIVVGSGLVGSLWSIYLSRAGYRVTVFERRPDLRNANISGGKSINLATSFRGWKALEELGIDQEIKKIAIPMYGRTLHHLEGSEAFQPYGINGQAIFSVSRKDINCKLMDLAEAEGNVKILFNMECIGGDADSGIVTVKHTETGELHTIDADVVFATDGAFSAFRYHCMQKLDRFSYSQNYIPDGYREILLPSNANGSFKLEKNTLHIWPRGRFMLIALPNFDGSFTCTLFMPFEDHEYCFNQLTTKEKVEEFFKNMFPDFFKMMPHVADTWEQHPLSSLAIIRCFPWTHGKSALMGDSAHATVPFFGQGMNAGFEDCSVMNELMLKHNHNWTEIFKEYETKRKPNGDAVQDLSLLNYLVMRDKVADPTYQLQQKIERRMAELYPGHYFPLYSMVSFTDIEYQVALKKGQEQDAMVLELIRSKNIDESFDLNAIDSLIHDFFKETH